MEEFVNSLNLPFDGQMSAHEYLITLDNSDDFSQLYNVISSNEDLEVDENAIATPDNSMFTFRNDTYEILISADFKKDVYRCVITEA